MVTFFVYVVADGAACADCVATPAVNNPPSMSDTPTDEIDLERFTVGSPGGTRATSCVKEQ